MGTRSFLIFMLLVLAGIVIGAILGSRKDKPKRDQYWAEYKRFQDKVVNGEAMTEEDMDFAARHYPESMMEKLLFERRKYHITKEEFEVRRMVIWKIEDLKKEKLRLENEKTAAAEQQNAETGEERERQLAQLKGQLDAGLIDKAEYEEKCKKY